MRLSHPWRGSYLGEIQDQGLLLVYFGKFAGRNRLRIWSRTESWWVHHACTIFTNYINLFTGHASINMFPTYILYQLASDLSLTPNVGYGWISASPYYLHASSSPNTPPRTSGILVLRAAALTANSWAPSEWAWCIYIIWNFSFGSNTIFWTAHRSITIPLSLLWWETACEITDDNSDADIYIKTLCEHLPIFSEDTPFRQNCPQQLAACFKTSARNNSWNLIYNWNTC